MAFGSGVGSKVFYSYGSRNNVPKINQTAS